MKFDPQTMQGFMFKWTAEFYAWRARLRGYKTKISSSGNNWIENGARWWVALTK